jgi:hypothetical protein
LDRLPLNGLAVASFRNGRQDIRRRDPYAKTSTLMPDSAILARPLEFTITDFDLIFNIHFIPCSVEWAH